MVEESPYSSTQILTSLADHEVPGTPVFKNASVSIGSPYFPNFQLLSPRFYSPQSTPSPQNTWLLGGLGSFPTRISNSVSGPRAFQNRGVSSPPSQGNNGLLSPLTFQSFDHQQLVTWSGARSPLFDRDLLWLSASQEISSEEESGIKSQKSSDERMVPELNTGQVPDHNISPLADHNTRPVPQHITSPVPKHNISSPPENHTSPIFTKYRRALLHSSMSHSQQNAADNRNFPNPDDTGPSSMTSVASLDVCGTPSSSCLPSNSPSRLTTTPLHASPPPYYPMSSLNPSTPTIFGSSSNAFSPPSPSTGPLPSHCSNVFLPSGPTSIICPDPASSPSHTTTACLSLCPATNSSPLPSTNSSIYSPTTTTSNSCPIASKSSPCLSVSTPRLRGRTNIDSPGTRRIINKSISTPALEFSREEDTSPEAGSFFTPIKRSRRISDCDGQLLKACDNPGVGAVKSSTPISLYSSPASAKSSCPRKRQFFPRRNISNIDICQDRGGTFSMKAGANAVCGGTKSVTVRNEISNRGNNSRFEARVKTSFLDFEDLDSSSAEE